MKETTKSTSTSHMLIRPQLAGALVGLAAAALIIFGFLSIGLAVDHRVAQFNNKQAASIAGNPAAIFMGETVKAGALEGCIIVNETIYQRRNPPPHNESSVWLMRCPNSSSVIK